VKAIADISYAKGAWLHWRAGVSAGIGAFIGNEWCYPSLHMDFMVYHGGIGSKWPGVKKCSYLDVETSFSYMLTAGYKNRLKNNVAQRPEISSFPLYYFNTFQAQPLQNPYIWSASFGGNVIWFITRKKNKMQQVGFANVHLNRIQLSYLNDGPFFPKPFGDRFDRLHTGGGFISYHGDRKDAVDLFEIGFNKFTGYNQNSYELANRIGTSYIYYKDTTQHHYNKGRIYFNAISTNRQRGVNFSLNNINVIDIQHRIHLRAFYPLHMVPYKGFVSIAPIFYFSQTTIGMQ
jgi:hypothetical protein